MLRTSISITSSHEGSGCSNQRGAAEVDVFSYLGELAVRQIHLAGLSLTRNRFVLYCNNPFGPYLARTWAPSAPS